MPETPKEKEGILPTTPMSTNTCPMYNSEPGTSSSSMKPLAGGATTMARGADAGARRSLLIEKMPDPGGISICARTAAPQHHRPCRAATRMTCSQPPSAPTYRTTCWDVIATEPCAARLESLLQEAVRAKVARRRRDRDPRPGRQLSLPRPRRAGDRRGILHPRLRRRNGISATYAAACSDPTCSSCCTTTSGPGTSRSGSTPRRSG